MSAVARALDRGREDLRAADALLGSGFPSQAIERAYVGALHAAEAALLAVDRLPSTEAGVVSAFGREVVVHGGLEPAHARALRRLYDDARSVDDALAEAPPAAARLSVQEAAALLAATERWIAERVGATRSARSRSR
ncbi:MAG TPA: hypothetical protein VFT50_04800 [Baekduia sp.]|nr:hypothetical protein [Baekduia sp.]